MKKRITAFLLVLVLAATLSLPAVAVDYYPRYNGTSESIVDVLNSYGEPSSFDARTRIADANGISASEYCGSASQNRYLVEQAKQGRLVRPGSSTVAATSEPAAGSAISEYYPKFNGSSESIVDVLNSYGEPSSYDARTRIADANGISASEYCGSESQNRYLVGLAKQGRLVRPGNSSSAAAGVLVSNSGSDSDIMEVVDRTPLRPKAKGSSKTDLYLHNGDYVHVTGKTTNKAGSTWYEVNYGGVKLYCHEDHLRPHAHSFRTVCDGVSVCSCGKISRSGAQLMNSAAMADTLLSGELQAIYFLLSSGMGAAASAVGAVAPYAAAAVVVVVVIAGVSYLVKVSDGLSQVEVVEAFTVDTPRAEFERLDSDLYYAAYTKAKDCLLVYCPEGMDLEEANDYLVALSYFADGMDFATQLIKQVQTESGCTTLKGIYTNNKENAKRLAVRFTENGPAFTYGSSQSDLKTGGDTKSEVGVWDQCYEHYHLFTPFKEGEIHSVFSKVRGVHLFWGLPVCSDEYFVAVA